MYVLQLALMEWKWKARKAQASCQLVYFQCLAIWPALAKLFHHQKFCCCLFYDIHLIMVDDTQPCAVLCAVLEIEIYDKIWGRCPVRWMRFGIPSQLPSILAF